jgi:hypothetical protein
MRVLGWIVFACLLSTIVYLFYFHGYRRWIANSSFSSTVELVRRKIFVSQNARTLVLGNSAAAEGFPASVYNKQAGESTPAVNLGIPSGHMFLYDKVLDMALDHGLHPTSVVLIVTADILSFSADPYYDYLKNDLTVLKVELRANDLARIGSHSRSLLHRLDYSAPVLLRPALYSGDLRDLVSNPVQRVKDSNFVSGWLDTLTAPELFPEPDHAFTVCQAEPLETLGERLVQERQKVDNPILVDLERVWNGYEGRAAGGANLKVDQFEKQRLRELLMRFAQRVPHVFLAPAPYYDPHFTQLPAEYRRSLEANLHELTDGLSGVHLLPEFPADCQTMMDTVHLNRKGGEQFAAFLKENVEGFLRATHGEVAQQTGSVR